MLVRPTILAEEPDQQPDQVRVMQQSTSDVMRRLMRLVVTDGFGKTAEVPGYYPGGKTGTAEKVTAHGGYKKHANVAAFMSVFPMNAPRYAVYMMLDEPHATKSTFGYATAGWVIAPAAGKVIARIGPMLGMLPDLVDMPAINQALAIPLQPTRPPGVTARGPGIATPAADVVAKTPSAPSRPNLTVPATVLPPAISRPAPDIQRQTKLVPSASTAPSVVRVSAAVPVAAR
jgi:cell division protein FtsI (penicillin-binding protein 3)